MSAAKTENSRHLPICAVLLAGGRGTRFWPRSRTRTPKQLLNIVGRDTMLRQTVKRLTSLISPGDIWVVTNGDQAAAVHREVPEVPSKNVLAEPVGRNTAAAIGLAAIHLARRRGDTLMAVLPSDAYVRDVGRYRNLLRSAFDQARTPGNLVVLGIPPTRPETGYGYIERGAPVGQLHGASVFAVRRFTEKPALRTAQNYVASNKHSWNAGMFVWRVSTFLENLRQFLPATHDALQRLARTIGTRNYDATLHKIYPRLENISVDYAVMEPATRVGGKPQVFVIPAEIGWSDLGSWTAVYELIARKTGKNVSAGELFALDANGNYVWSPKKFVAVIGAHDLIVVETDDALLLCSRDRSQDVGKIVKRLERQRRADLL